MLMTESATPSLASVVRIQPANTTSTSVSAMLQAVVDGDAEAAHRLYDEMSPELLRRLRGRYGNIFGEPEDLLQDAFLFYFQNDYKVLRDFMSRESKDTQTRSRLAGALWDLACGLVANRRRAQRSRDRVFDPFQSSDQLKEADTGIYTVAEQRDRLRDLERHLAAEDPDLASYCRLRFVHGYSPTEIAEHTGKPLRTVYKLRRSLSDALHNFATSPTGLAQAA